jgi:transposase
MWPAETRRMYDRKGLRYPTDMTDAEWELARPFVDVAQSRSGQRRVVLREVLNAVFYILGTGCQWRAVPKDLPPRSTVHDYFVRWQCDGTLGRLHHALYEQARELAGKEASPTTAIVDSQSVKGAERGGRPTDPVGYDAAKKVNEGQRAQAPRRRGHARPDARLRQSAWERAGSGWLPGCSEGGAATLSLSGAGDRGWRLPGPGDSPRGASGSTGQPGNRQAIRRRQGLCGAPEALDCRTHVRLVGARPASG